MLERVLECRARDPDQARRGRWLNLLLLSFLVIILPVVLVDIALPQLPLAPGLPVNAGAAIAVLGIYIINRRGYVTLSAVALVAALTATILGLTLVVNLGLTAALVFPFYFAVVIGTAGIFLSWRAVLAVVLALIAVALAYYATSPALITYQAQDPFGGIILGFSLLILFCGTGALSWLSSQVIGEALGDLRTRNHELEAANHVLADQVVRERQVVEAISALIGQLGTVSTRQVANVESQDQAIRQVVSTMAQLHATATQIASGAYEVRTATDTALTSVQRGQHLVFQSREAVQRNRAQVQQVIERMNTLGQLTARITHFVNNIRAIADETQLLALNATIEAAGAGSLGRRFSVVAAEVQNLSSRSNIIVDQIQALITELQQAGQVALYATQDSITVANEVEALADEVRGVQEQVVGVVRRTSDLVHMIATATGEQTGATEHVTETMREIAQVAGTTRQDSTALDQVSRELRQAAALLLATPLEPPPPGTAPASVAHTNGAHDGVTP